MPTTVSERILMIFFVFGENWSSMHLYMDILVMKCRLCTNLQESHREGEQNIIAILNLFDNAQNGIGTDFAVLFRFWRKFGKYASIYAHFGAEMVPLHQFTGKPP